MKTDYSQFVNAGELSFTTVSTQRLTREEADFLIRVVQLPPSVDETRRDGAAAVSQICRDIAMRYTTTPVATIGVEKKTK